MKLKLQFILLLAIGTAVWSCKKDNYDPPNSKLEGRIVYQGEAINVEYNQVPYEFYQYGFGKVGSIGSSFEQDGSFSALLFDGEYKMIIPTNQGPFLRQSLVPGKSDTVVINLKGSQTLDIEVMPYYMIRTPNLAVAAGKVNATFKVEKIVSGTNEKAIENVALYINKTQFVSGGDNIANVSIAGSAITDPNNITLSVTIPTITITQNYVFARIGLKVQGVEDRIFSPLVKLQF